VEREQGGCGARGLERSQEKKAKASWLDLTPFIEVSGRNVLGLARADSELEGAKGSSTRKSDDVAEIDLVRALANARTSLGDALEMIRARLGEAG
jgi:hypothetical protein